jgi:hypothetical protein
VQKLPWLEYAGQTAPELVACKHSHQIDSVFLAFEEGIQNKLDQQGRITEDEQAILAVLALRREVNDGGHRQFFLKASRRFVRIIESSLLRIDCDATAKIVADAVAALGSDDIHSEDPVRDEILADCDDRFYQINEIEENLLNFLEAHQDRIQLTRATAARRGKSSAFLNVSKLYSQLLCVQNTDYSLEWVRCLAEDLAQRQAIPVTESELDGAAVLYALDRSLKEGDLDACEPLALLAFDLMRDHTMQSVLHRDWIMQLIAASQEELADTATLAYLDYLRNSDPSLRLTQNRIKFWAAAVQEHATALPGSAKFFAETFPGVLPEQSMETEKKGAR